MMKSRITGKKVPTREYYIFFSFGSKHSGQYTTLREENIERAKGVAYTKYGAMNVGSVENDESRAKQKIYSYGFTELIS